MSASARFSTADSLVEVDASLSLPVIAKQCREAGWLFPLPGSLPPLSLADACARAPFLVDAYVSSAEAVSESGLPFATGRAPRAATGPDLLGALCSSPPLATCVRARVRVLAREGALGIDEQHAEVAAAVASFGRLLDEGRAFAAFARPATSGYRVYAVGGPAALPKGGRALVDAFDDEGRSGESGAEGLSTRSLAPGDRPALSAWLAKGRPLVAAPFMGRVAALVVEKRAARVFGGAASFANALARAGARYG